MNARTATLLDAGSPDFDPRSAIEVLERDGVVILRDLFAPATVDDVKARWKVYFSKPSVSGTVGFARTSHTKATVSAFSLGRSAVQMMLDERIIGIIETYMDSPCILAEANAKHDKGVGYTYFPLHSDFAVGWKKAAHMAKGLSEDDLKTPVGVGGAIYLHDTTEGAFTYSIGTHKWLSPHGQRFADYPAEKRKEILAARVRCDGRAGDFVLFDDRGFHGPDHPSRADRSVLLLDYYRVKTLGNVVVSPHPVWSTDLAGLSPTQSRVMGVGADAILPPESYDKARFRRNRFYPLLTWLIERAYLGQHWKNKIRHLLGRDL